RHLSLCFPLFPYTTLFRSFLSGESMKFAVDKIVESGNPNVILTDRGNTFGYSDLVVDFRNIMAMKAHQVPVVMDVTHSLQQPNQDRKSTRLNSSHVAISYA